MLVGDRRRFLRGSAATALSLAVPAEFDNDAGAWGWNLAQEYTLRGDSVRARAYADTARVALEEQLRDYRELLVYLREH